MARRATEISQEDAMALLAAVQARRDEATHLRITRIEEARALGVSWERIGEAMNMTGEGARRLLKRAHAQQEGT